jgi:type IV secretory pathway VirB10-like protein
LKAVFIVLTIAAPRTQAKEHLVDAAARTKYDRTLAERAAQARREREAADAAAAAAARGGGPERGDRSAARGDEAFTAAVSARGESRAALHRMPEQADVREGVTLPARITG